MSRVPLVVREKDGDKKPTRYFSKKQEDTIAKQLGGRRVANSGATMFQKGDIITDSFLLEAKTKTTSSKSISIKKEWLIKNKREALSMSKPYNALVFNFGPDEENYYVINEELFQDLLVYLENKAEE
ncbi:MAG: hypothetical protein M0Q88_00615 [Bacilli bacterium]|nr:hypothetical protein [Bacilli bacterium]